VNDGGTRIDGRSHLADDSPVIEARVFFGTTPVPMPDIATLTDEDGRFSLYTTHIDVDGTSNEIALDIEMG
jgi:hypothetical protein